GYTTFIGLDSGIDIEYTTRNDESTRCHFCPNDCARTFIDTKTPDGGTARYISGFSCEKGTVESEEAMLELTKQRKKLMKEIPNLVDYESKRLFAHFYDAEEMPARGATVDDVVIEKGFLGKLVKKPVRRAFQRSSEDAWKKRATVRVGIPRVLNVYSIAPFL